MKRCLFRSTRLFHTPITSRVIGRRYSLVNRSYLPRNRTMIFQQRFASVDMNVPNMGDSISEGTIVEICFKKGEYVNVDDIVAIIETDKVSIDVRASTAGVIEDYHCIVDDTVEVGAKLVSINPDGQAPAGGAAKPATPVPTPTPVAQKVAAPTPKVETPAPKVPTPAPKAPTPAPKAPTPVAAPSPAAVGGARTEKRVPMSRMRQRIAERLKEAQNTAACLTTFNEIDVSTFMSARKKYQEEFVAKHEVKLGLMSIFVKASCIALQDQPSVNAQIDGKEIIYKDYNDVAIAVASPNGLVVPVLRNAEGMSLAEIEKQILSYAKKAKTGSLALEDMVGGTFTISNGGVFGSVMGTPILNPPQSAILGMHGIFDTPVAVNGQVVIRPIMKVALSYDHRIIDGREATLFLRKIKQVVEDPMRLLFDL